LGGFGITYLALDLTLNTRMAIKEYFPHNVAARAPGELDVSVFESEEFSDAFQFGLNRFLDEARAISTFSDNPGIVNVHDFFKENKTAYMVMNYLEGQTLKQYLKDEGGNIPYIRAVSFIWQLLDALSVVHKTGLLHRDISPDNIYLTNDGIIKLLDFGAARYAIGEHSKSLSIVLKDGYAPEEQYRTRGKQGPWTDIYALAATFYSCITGQVVPSALDRMHEDLLIRPAEIVETLPAELEAVLLKALAVKGEDRYQSIDDFRKALQDVWAKNDVPAQETTPSPSFLSSNTAKAVSIELDENIPQRSMPKQDYKKRTYRPWLLIAGVIILFLSGLTIYKHNPSTSNSNSVSAQPQNITVANREALSPVGNNQLSSIQNPQNPPEDPGKKEEKPPDADKAPEQPAEPPAQADEGEKQTPSDTASKNDTPKNISADLSGAMFDREKLKSEVADLKWQVDQAEERVQKTYDMLIAVQAGHQHLYPTSFYESDYKDACIMRNNLKAKLDEKEKALEELNILLGY
jgi:serine/threonine protein kinase